MKNLEIHKIGIKGFKSIQNMPAFEPRSINVFIGFKFLSNMLQCIGNLAYM